MGLNEIKVVTGQEITDQTWFVKMLPLLMDDIQKKMLREIAGLTELPGGAFNIRVNGGSIGHSSTKNITIAPKEDKSGINITVSPHTVGETLHIPVILSESGLEEIVYNDFYIGADSDVEIIAGCGIHNSGHNRSQHDGIHTFHLGENARVRYVEKHYGEGDGTGERVLNPVTVVSMNPGSYMEMDTVQIKGVDSTKRLTKAVLDRDATLVVREKLMTHGDQFAETAFEVELNGDNAGAHLVSRSVAKDHSHQVFISKMEGSGACTGHSECDAIIMDQASVKAVPEITANHLDAQLIHEAAIGKIAGDQIVKLMTLGLTEEDAVSRIVAGFLS